MTDSIAQRFRKKPVEIDALPVAAALHAAAHSWRQLPDWMEKAYDRGEVVFAPEAVLINTMEGQMRGDLGDWIIRGVKGELYPCKPDIFAATYDPVEA
jgi:hypothetical protein